ncbi:5'-3' exonuclease PLD3 isoform 2-T2 [Aulostomus maculatus]
MPFKVLKHCSVVLDRVDERSLKRELDEREDTSRKGGKPVSRIPTFQKRPVNASQSAELPLSRRDPPIHGVQPAEKAANVEASRFKLLDVRDKGLPLPSAHIPTSGFEEASLFSCPSDAAQQLVNPRPPLRTSHGLEEDQGAEADVVLYEPMSSDLPCEVSLSQRPQQDAPQRYEVTSRMTPAGSGDHAGSAEVAHTPEVSHDETIMNEEPPWGADTTTASALRSESRSSSDTDDEDELAAKEPDNCTSVEERERDEPRVFQSESEGLPHTQATTDKSAADAPQKPAKATATQPAKSTGCSSFVLFCFLPTTLLLLGGFGQHVWHYGLPLSVAQLSAQLHLHWLDGLGLAAEPCSTDCRVRLVESIPVGLYPNIPPSQPSIADSWLHLLDKANHSVHIAAFYLTLRASDEERAEATDSQGKKVFERLKQLESKGVEVQIAVNSPQTSTADTAELAASGADVREVHLKAVTGGIVHTKLWVVDQKHLYLGSANMDWRSLTQVKEVGVSVENCSCLAQDALRIFGLYWSIGGSNNGSLPLYWPARFSALSSSQHPLHLSFNGVPARVYLSSAPPQISARRRSDDLTTILSVIGDAQKFIFISVMDYLPLSQFTEPLRFWPDIDTALRAAACTRGVKLRLLVSCWKHSPASMFPFLQSLVALNRPPLTCDIEVRVFTVPSTAEQIKIPFARVNHAKYMVTDRVLYVGTSNWSENYFTRTAGVGLVVNQTGSSIREDQLTLQAQAEQLFLRDWTSQYASALAVNDLHVCPHGQH